MFNNNVEDEADFCEAYKSQILNDDSTEKTSSLATFLKIVTIILLLAIIVAVSIYGYNYFMNNSNSNISSNVVSPPVSIQALEEDELGDFKVELAEEPEKVSPISSLKKEAIEELKVIEEPVMLKSVDELDIDKIANDVKLAIAKNEEAEQKAAESVKSENRSVESKPLEIPVEDSQSAYLEELAKLSKEIDKERE